MSATNEQYEEGKKAGIQLLNSQSIILKYFTIETKQDSTTTVTLKEDINGLVQKSTDDGEINIVKDLIKKIKVKVDALTTAQGPANNDAKFNNHMKLLGLVYVLKNVFYLYVYMTNKESASASSAEQVAALTKQKNAQVAALTEAKNAQEAEITQKDAEISKLKKQIDDLISLTQKLSTFEDKLVSNASAPS